MKDTLVTVNTTYARIALILLAGNLLLTGYTISKVIPTDEPVQDTRTQQASSTGDSSENRTEEPTEQQASKPGQSK
jgi:hypothetical protein